MHTQRHLFLADGAEGRTGPAARVCGLDPIWRAVRNIAAKHDKSYPSVRKPGAARGADRARHKDFVRHPANEGLELNKLSATYSIQHLCRYAQHAEVRRLR